MSVIRSRPAHHRQFSPVLEYEGDRSPELGFEIHEPSCWIRCLAHGYPTPLARWHFHDEFELHLITATSGRAFVGNWVGSFRPGHLVLCGSQLPHNWVSDDVPPGGVAERDLVILFRHEPLVEMASHVPEFREISTLLDRARHGIEFFGLSASAEAHWHAVRASHGARRVMAFMLMLIDLAQCQEYRLLSPTFSAAKRDHDPLEQQLQGIIDRITQNPAHAVRLDALAAECGISPSRFSRLFHRLAGNTLTDFLAQLRITDACRLLMQTNRPVNDICFLVGYNNLANFNRRFLALKGMTPTEFRRQAAYRFNDAGT